MVNLTERSIDRAARLLLVYGQWTGEESDQETCLTDLLADLLHWCDSMSVDMDECYQRAIGHFVAECRGEL